MAVFYISVLLFLLLTSFFPPLMEPIRFRAGTVIGSVPSPLWALWEILPKAEQCPALPLQEQAVKPDGAATEDVPVRQVQPDLPNQTPPVASRLRPHREQQDGGRGRTERSSAGETTYLHTVPEELLPDGHATAAPGHPHGGETVHL